MRPELAPRKGVECPRWFSPMLWKTSSVGFRARRSAPQPESGSGSNVTDHVAVDGSNNIAHTVDVDDPHAIKAMLASPPPEILERMEAHGVVPPFTAYIEA